MIQICSDNDDTWLPAVVSGDVGIVVHAYRYGRAREVVFVAVNREMATVETVETKDLRSVRRNESAQVRPLAVA